MAKQIYACYRNDCGIEFWSSNKKMFNEYLNMYGRYMAKNEYSIIIQPISQYRKFKSKYHEDELAVVRETPWNCFDSPVITTSSMATMMNICDFLTDELYLEYINPSILEYLPKRIQAIIRKTHWYDFIVFNNNPIDIESDIFNMNRISYIMYAKYYSCKEMFDLFEDTPSLTAI